MTVCDQYVTCMFVSLRMREAGGAQWVVDILDGSEALLPGTYQPVLPVERGHFGSVLN